MARLRSAFHVAVLVRPLFTGTWYPSGMETIIAKGDSGTVTFDGERVVLAHKMGTKSVPIGNVSHTLYRRGGWGVDGVWSIAVTGQVVDLPTVLGVRARMNPDLVVVRGKRQKAAFDALTAAIDAALTK